MRYLAASVLIAAAGAVYGLFSHGVYSYYMTYAFMIPLLAGAVPHLLAAMKGERAAEKTSAAAVSSLSMADECDEDRVNGTVADENTERPARTMSQDPGSAQLAFIVTLTAGSLLKGALDIYGTTNRLLIAYPAAALLILMITATAAFRQSGKPAKIRNKETKKDGAE
jgi:hypothetical protein